MLTRTNLLPVAASIFVAACSDDATSSAGSDLGTDTSGPTDVPAGIDDLGPTSDVEDEDVEPDFDANDAEVGPIEVPFDPLPLVHPFVGTGAAGFNYGAIPLGPALPFSLVRLSPNTGDVNANQFGVGHAGGYRYEDPYLLGFSHYHLVGVGIGDAGNLRVMPVRGQPSEQTVWTEYRAGLDHSAEVAEPGYYRVDLPDRGVRAELTATRRVGVHRYTFSTDVDGPASILVDLGAIIGDGKITESTITVDPATGALSGSLHSLGDFAGRFGGYTLYFAGRMSRPPVKVHTFKDGPPPPAKEPGTFVADSATVSGVNVGAVIEVDPTGGPIELAIALSFVDGDGAQAALEAEFPEDATFDTVLAAARAKWTEHLSRVRVKGGTHARTRILYTALYHTLLMPTLMTDVDGRYRGIDQQVHTAEGFTYYSDLSLWDTYRTFHPLMTFLYPEYQADFLRSLAAMAKDWGGLPRWPLAIGEGGSMIGTSADIVFGDAELAGGSPVAPADIWPAVKDTAFGKHPLGKTDKDRIEPYMSLGYVPIESGNGSVSHTLEYATADACGAVLAKAAGDAASAELLAARAGSWKNHLDADRGFLAPKREDGTIPKYGQTEHSSDYIEGSAWQYTFMVPQDVPGLVKAIGKTRFLEHLFGLMEGTRTDFQPLLPTGTYWHGNEPNLLAPFLFGHAGRSDLGNWWAHWVADNLYTLEPGGLAGNDDGGTLSAWYVLAAAGIYPLNCTGEFTLTSPLFDEVVWNMPAGLGRPATAIEFRLDAPFEEDLVLPQWNDVPVGPTLTVQQLIGGGVLRLPMAMPPNEQPSL